MSNKRSFSEKPIIKRKKKLSDTQLIEGILKGDTTLLGRAITLIESTNPAHREQARAVIEGCISHAGGSVRIGITGVPGVGKSTFIEAFGSFLIEEQKRKVAVLAIDPSSSQTGGSILGDKTRMHNLSRKKAAFIRPSPAAGTLGGVARATRETIVLCEAAGFDTILVETVGVGQSETAVSSMVDFFLLLMLAGAGDELQGIKRGIMELADMLVINKADGENIAAAKRAQREYRNALHLLPAKASGWQPVVETCSSLSGTGIDQVWKQADHFLEQVRTNGHFEANRNRQALDWFEQTVETLLKYDFYNDPGVKEHLPILKTTILKGNISPFHAAEQLMKQFKRKDQE